MTDIPLKCRCGEVKGTAIKVTPEMGSRLVCYCDDCQAFAKCLDGEKSILNQYGGTDIFQMPVSYIKVVKGIDKICCLKLKQRGSFRWYTQCCKTPIGLTMSAGVPFIGLTHNFMDDTGVRDTNLGPVLEHVQTRFAKEALPAETKQPSFPLGIMWRSLSKIIIWKLKGLNRPSIFFDENGKPLSTPEVINAN